MNQGKRYPVTETDPAVELKAWRMTFKSGYDFLRALPKIGIDISGRHQPAQELAEDAWRRLGSTYLDARDPEQPTAWAERQFGQPEDMPPPPPRRAVGAKRRAVR